MRCNYCELYNLEALSPGRRRNRLNNGRKRRRDGDAALEGEASAIGFRTGKGQSLAELKSPESLLVGMKAHS